MHLKSFFTKERTTEEAITFRKQIIQEGNLEEVLSNCVLFTTEETVLLPFVNTLVALAPVSESLLSEMKNKLVAFGDVCKKDRLFKNIVHENGYKRLIDTVERKLSDEEEIFIYRAQLLETCIKHTMCDSSKELMGEIDNCILQMPDMMNVKKIKDIINVMDDNSFTDSIYDLFTRSFVFANIPGLEKGEYKDMAITVGERIEHMEYVDSPRLSTMKSIVLNECNRYKNIAGDTSRIEDVKETLLGYLNKVSESVNESVGIIESCDSILLKGRLEFTNICESISDIQLENVLRNIELLSKQYNSISLEGKVEKSLVKGANKVEQGVTKGVHAAKTAGRSVKNVGKAISEIPKSLDNEITNFVNKIIDADKEKRKERLLNKGIRVRLFKFIRKAIIGGVTASAFGPIGAAISVLGSFAADKHLDAKVRREVLRDLEQELKIVEEKIDDAKSAGDNKNKYQLMRTKDKLEHEISRVRYYLSK